MTSLRALFDRLLGRGSEQPDPEPPAPQTTQQEQDAAELRGEALEEHERKRDSGEDDGDRLVDV